MGLESAGIGLAHAISPVAAKFCRASSGRVHGRTLRQRLLDTGTGLMAGWISLGLHDGDSLGPARSWDR
jgi:hypothetical protein